VGLVCSNTALAAPCDKGGAQAQGRPRIGLVLGGGGARGAAAWEASSSGPAVHLFGDPPSDAAALFWGGGID